MDDRQIVDDDHDNDDKQVDSYCSVANYDDDRLADREIDTDRQQMMIIMMTIDRQMCAHAQLLGCVQLFETLWTVSHQAPLTMEFFQQEDCSGLPFPAPGDLPTQGLNPHVLCLLH